MAFFAPLIPMLASAASSAGAAASTAAGAIGSAASAVGTSFSAYGGLWSLLAAAGSAALSGATAIASNRQQSAMMEAQAEMAKDEAKGQVQAGKSQSAKLAEERRRLLGMQTAMYGASGVSPGTGSPLQVYAQTARDYEADIGMTGYNAQAQARTSMIESASQKWAAKMRRQTGMLEGATTLLGGLGRIYARR